MRSLGSLDLDLLAGLRVDTGAGVSLQNFERSEAGQLDLAALLGPRPGSISESVSECFGIFFS